MDVAAGCPPGTFRNSTRTSCAKCGVMLDHARTAGRESGFWWSGRPGREESLGGAAPRPVREAPAGRPGVRADEGRVRRPAVAARPRPVRQGTLTEYRTTSTDHAPPADPRKSLPGLVRRPGSRPVRSASGTPRQGAAKADHDTLLAGFAKSNDLDYDLRSVLPKLDKADFGGLAVAWLREATRTRRPPEARPRPGLSE